MVSSFKNITKHHYLKPSNYYSKNFSPDFSMWFHTHNYIEIMYCENGSFTFEVSREEQTVFSKIIHSGECVIITDTVYHKILTPNPCEIFNIEFEICQGHDEVYALDMNYLLVMSDGLSRVANDPNGFSIIKSGADLRNTLLSLIKLLSLNSEKFEDKLRARLLIYQLFALIGKSNSFSDEKIGIRYIHRALDFIQSNLISNITVDNVAKAAGISKSYLQRLFKKYYKIQVHDYISSKRIEYSKQLLAGTQLTQKKIALSSGFNNYNQFLYMFKQKCGISPGEYRNSSEKPQIKYTHADRHKYSAIPPLKK